MLVTKSKSSETERTLPETEKTESLATNNAASSIHSDPFNNKKTLHIYERRT